MDDTRWEDTGMVPHAREASVGILSETPAARFGCIDFANRAPRCQHIKTNGARCGSPALRGQPLCHFHHRFTGRPYPTDFPLLEDANAIQIAIMMVVRNLFCDLMSYKAAALALYGLQIASSNLKRVDFTVPEPEEEKLPPPEPQKKLTV